jgi:hypothetical protein
MGARGMSVIKALLGLGGMGVAFISVGGHALYKWYETGQMPLHHGFRSTVSYATDTFAFTYEFGGNIFLMSMGIAASAVAVFGLLSLYRRTRKTNASSE